MALARARSRPNRKQPAGRLNAIAPAVLSSNSLLLLNWKLGIRRSIDDVVAQAGPRFTAIYQASFAVPPQGIEAADEQDFYMDLALKVFQWTNYGPTGWFDLLSKHGPLSITVDADPGKNFIHALVLIGLDGDGTAGKTITSYIDPAERCTRAPAEWGRIGPQPFRKIPHLTQTAPGMIYQLMLPKENLSTR
jgi:hypothetical protein